MKRHHSLPERLIEYLVGAMLFLAGWALILTLVGAGFGIPMSAAGLALLLPERQ